MANSYQGLVDQCHDLARQYLDDYRAGRIDADMVHYGFEDIAETLYRNGYHLSDLSGDFRELLTTEWDSL